MLNLGEVKCWLMYCLSVFGWLFFRNVCKDLGDGGRLVRLIERWWVNCVCLIVGEGLRLFDVSFFSRKVLICLWCVGWVVFGGVGELIGLNDYNLVFRIDSFLFLLVIVFVLILGCGFIVLFLI